MKRRPTYRAIMPSLLLALALLLQSLAPSLAAAQSSAGFNISAYLCNQTAPASQEGASEAEAALTDILRLAGQLPDNDTDIEDAPHCQFCLINSVAITSPALGAAAPQIYDSPANLFGPARSFARLNATGPPLGGRAPPNLF